MCQFLCCECWWFNCCGVICGGCHEAACIYSYWCCKPDDLAAIDPECCHICACDGWGGNGCCWGNVCCAPDAVKQWSQMLSGGGGAIVVTNNY